MNMNKSACNMIAHNNREAVYLTFPSFEKYTFVNHAFSTRCGGVSQNEYASMNLNFGRGDPVENVIQNYRIFCDAAGFNFDTLVASSQDHHTFVRRVDSSNLGTGIWRPKDLTSVDGLITNAPNVTLVTYYADCVPLFFLDPEKRAIGLSHAGWRGTVAQIGKITVEAMTREFGSRPQDIVAAVGPSIGPCCFEVDAPVYEEFLKLEDLRPREIIAEKSGGKYNIDLWEANRRSLISAGILESQITVAKLCTRCNSDWLYSHRASGGKRGGLAAMMCITEGKE